MATLNYNITAEDLFRSTYKYSEAKQLIEEFKASDATVAEILYGEDEYKNENSVRTTYTNIIRRMHCSDILGITTRGKRAFILKKMPE